MHQTAIEHIFEKPVSTATLAPPRLRWEWFLLGCIALALLMGCEEEAPPQFCDNEDDLALTRSCDISTIDCQQAVFNAALCVNQSHMPMPPIRIITETQHLAELGLLDTASEFALDFADTDSTDPDSSAINPLDTDSSDTEAADTDSQETDTATEDAFDWWDESMRLLGLLGPKQSEAQATNTDFAATALAYYSPEYQDITIIQHDTSNSSLDAMHTLAHEFVHAVQDHEFGLSELSELYSYDDDVLISIQSEIEGDASVRSEFATALLVGVPVGDLQLDDFYSRYVDYVRMGIAEPPSAYVFAKNMLPYATGAQYVYETFKNEGIEGMNRLREDFPTASVYWMAGYDASQPAAGYSAPTHFERPLQCATPNAPDGYILRHKDSLGAVLLFAALSGYSETAPVSFDVDTGWNLALSWREDALTIFTAADMPQVAVSWHIRMATVEDAERLASLLMTKMPHARTRLLNRELQLFVSSDPLITESWLSTYRCVKYRTQEAAF